MPLISIVMPAYNTSRFIQESIESVLNQTYSNWELIVVDDGSTDHTVSAIEQFVDPRIKLILLEHCGYIGRVHNAGLAACSGDYIAFLDSDDVYEPYSLDVRLSYMREHPECTAVYGFLRCIDSDSNPLPHDKMVRPSVPGNPDLVDLQNYRHTWRAILSGDVAGILPVTLLRRETFEAVGYEQTEYNFAHDYLYYVRLFMHDFEGIHAIPHYVYRYRRFATSNTRNRQRFLEALADVPRYCGWVFGPGGIPAEHHHLESVTYARQYGHLIRSRLLNRDLQQLAQSVTAALYDPKVSFLDWVLYCCPFLLRYFSPALLDKFLIRVWSIYKIKLMYRGLA